MNSWIKSIATAYRKLSQSPGDAAERYQAEALELLKRLDGALWEMVDALDTEDV